MSFRDDIGHFIVASIYERFLSNSFDTKIIRLRHHFRQIYLFGQIKIQNFAPSRHSVGIPEALCRHGAQTLEALGCSGIQGA